MTCWRRFDEAQRFKDEYVSKEHLFLAIATAGRLILLRHCSRSQGASHDAHFESATEPAVERGHAAG